MNKIIVVFLVFILVGCATTTKKSLNLEPDMTKQEVVQILGEPDARTFKGDKEAWQYQEIVGFGQCSYMTVWIDRGKVIGVTSRRGSSIAGCGLGSRTIDWGQMPKPSIDVNINIKEGP